MSAKIEPSQIPYTDVDTTQIQATATALGGIASAVRDGGADVVRAWSAIAKYYSGPGDQELFATMNPVGTQTTTFGDDLDKVVTALNTFARSVEKPVANLTQYKSDADALRARQDAKSDWDHDQDLVDENNRIVNGVGDEVVAYESAERTCANTIRALDALPPLHATQQGDGHDPLAYGYSSLDGAKLPWGSHADKHESCAHNTVMFVPHVLGGAVTGIGSSLEGLGNMVGISVNDWHFHWSWDTVKSTWGGMGALIGRDPTTGKWSWGTAGHSWVTVGKSTLAWDEWGKDPGKALGEVTWGIGSLFIPGVGEADKVGAAGRAGSVAGDLGKASGAARALSVAGKAVRLADPLELAGLGLKAVRMPKVSEFAASLGEHLGVGKGSSLADVAAGKFHFSGEHGHADVPSVRPDGGSPAPSVGHAPGDEPVRVGGGDGPGEHAHVGADGGHGGSGGGGGHHGGSDGGSGGGHHGSDDGSNGGGHHGGDEPKGDDAPKGGDSEPGADGAGVPDDNAGPGATSTATPDASHWLMPGEKVVDSAGHDISHVIDQSALSPRELSDYLKATDPKGWADFDKTGVWPADQQIPRDMSVIDPATGRIDWNQAPHNGYVSGSAHNYVPPVGEVIDRFGPGSGRFTSPVGENGSYTYPQRAVPYIEDGGQYHQYEVTGNLGNIKSYYDDAAPELREYIDLTMSEHHLTWNDIVVKRGDIAEAFGEPGGGVQIQMPLSVEVLERLGLLKELSR